MRSADQRRFRTPPPLREGAHVRVIGPSSPFDPDAFAAGVAWLSTRYRVTHAPDVLARHGYLAGDDARRRAELEAALDDPDVDAVVAARGGYGAMRILDGIDPARVASRPRWLVGFSDVTALHALWARAGVGSIHGAMVASLGRAGEAERATWTAALEGGAPPSFEGLGTIARGTAEGPLLGGNLALLAAMVGTPLAPPIDGAVLLLEDVGEAPYRIDRMLTQLRLSGVLGRVAAVALGSFERCGPGPDGTTVDAVLADRLGDLGVPVVRGLPVGHHEGASPVPLGVDVRVDADAGRVTFLQGGLAAGGPPA